ETARFALAVGCFLVAAQTLDSGYRTMWRYTSLREARVVALSCFAVLAGLLVAAWLGLARADGATMLLTALLILFLCIGARTLRRWQVVEAKRPRRGRSLAAFVGASHRVLI